jgi:hypothetical protein
MSADLRCDGLSSARRGGTPFRLLTHYDKKTITVGRRSLPCDVAPPGCRKAEP